MIWVLNERLNGTRATNFNFEGSNKISFVFLFPCAKQGKHSYYFQHMGKHQSWITFSSLSQDVCSGHGSGFPSAIAFLESE